MARTCSGKIGRLREEAIMSALRLTLLLGLMGFLLAAAPAEDRGDTSPSANLERNRRLLARWREDPEHYARLQNDLRAFWELPPEQRERLRRFDRELHQLDPATQKRLWGVLERYSVWLEHLPAEERQQIEAATDRNERLRLIRAIRERQWLERLPRRLRQELADLPEAERARRVEQLRKDEQRQRREWQKPLKPRSEPRSLRPANLRDFPEEVQHFVRKVLEPALDEKELARLRRAEGKWPDLPRTLEDLTQRRLSLPPLRSGPIKSWDNVPEKARLVLPRLTLQKRGQWEKLQQHAGKWPDYALAYVALLTPGEKELMPPLGASRPDEFLPRASEFIEHRLLAEIGQADAQRLRKLEGKWPEYPRLLLRLAREHGLSIPGLMLPGPQEIWEAAQNNP
jgi:hypothetical protein